MSGVDKPKVVNFKDFSRPNKEIKYFSRTLSNLNWIKGLFKTTSKFQDLFKIVRIHVVKKKKLVNSHNLSLNYLIVLSRENWCWSLLENEQLVLHHCCKTSLHKRRYVFAFFRWAEASEKRASSTRHETCATGEGTPRSLRACLHLSEINTWSAGYCKMGWGAMLRVLPPTTRPRLAAIKVVAGCGKLLEKLESSYTL